MHKLWSRAASAQPTSRCVSFPSTGATGITSQGTTAASKRRFRFANSITAFYSSIFAGAALADARFKNKRRAEWEEKIAAVNEEIGVLLDEEKRLLSTLDSRRRRRSVNGAVQTRSYSTAIPSSDFETHRLREEEDASNIHYEYEGRNQFGGGFAAATEGGIEDLEDLKKDDDEMDLETDPAPGWLSGPYLQQKAVQLLALKQLAIRLLLRPSIGHNYAAVQMNYPADFDAPRMDVSNLLDELNRLRNRICYVKENEMENIDDVVHGLRSKSAYEIQRERIRLDSEMDRDTEIYISGRMSLEELLLRLASNLTQSTDPDRPVAFKYMLLAFGHTRQNDLGKMVLRTLLPHAFLLNSPLIITILHFLRKTKDLKNFDLFLNMLRGEGYPVNLGKMPLFKQKVINGIDLTVPALDSSNPVLYSAMIMAALRFDQPERADAFLQAARVTGFMDDYTTLFAYLRYCAIRKDWWSGLSSLKRAVAYLASTTAHIEEKTERLIVWMVRMCDECGKQDLSEVLIKAAMDSGFDPGIGEKQWDIHFPTDPDYERWQKAAESVETEMRAMPFEGKCFSFANVAGDILNGVEESSDPAQVRQKKAGQFSQSLLSAVLTKRRTEHQQSESSALDSGDGAEDPRILGDQNAQDLAAAFDKQTEEIANLKLNVGYMQQTFDETLNSHRSIIAEQKELITNLQTELDSTKKSLKTAVQRHQMYAVNFDEQRREMQSLKTEFSGIRKALRKSKLEPESQDPKPKISFTVAGKPESDSPGGRRKD